MAVDELFTASLVGVNTASGADFDLTDLENWSMDPGIASAVRRGAGEVVPTLAAQMGIGPSLGFSTPQLATFLAGVAATGLIIDSDVDDEGLEASLKQYDQGATRKAGSNHIKLTVNEGILVPRTLNGAHDGVAMATANVLCTYDGTNAPIVIAASQAIAVPPSATEMFTVGPVSANGTTLAGVQSIMVDFGLAAIVRGGDGEVYPTFSAIDGQFPRIVVAVDKATYLATVGIGGIAVNASDVIVYFRKLADGSTRVANNVAEHIKITVDKGIIQPGPVTFGAGPATPTIEIVPTFDGSNAILVIDETSAIT